ncbi:CDP-glucose 4,6-dehydratase [bacterium HR40]|nr:CDP-glucose 4,6-dehydratase [bacterium HR40]
MAIDPTFWLHRRVLVTGHSGFKGIWLCRCLRALGAEVAGVALPPEASAPFYRHARISESVTEWLGDIRDPALLDTAVRSFRPEIVFHLAARPLVLDGLKEPALTFEVNVVGTVRVLEAARRAPDLRAIVVVTSDKVYRHPARACAEEDPLGGHDPYSASKAAAELVVESYRRCHLEPEDGVGVATARAGNVIGSGDFSAHRIVPDLVRAMLDGRPPELRNPQHRRPWQHVLDALYGYLLLAQEAARDPHGFSGAWNFGPDDAGWTVAELAERFLAAWGGGRWQPAPPRPGLELPVQGLCARKAREKLGWQPLLGLARAVAWTVEGYRALLAGDDDGWLDRQIAIHLRAASASRIVGQAAVEELDAVA